MTSRSHYSHSHRSHHSHHSHASSRYDTDSEYSGWTSASDEVGTLAGPLSFLEGINATLIGMVARKPAVEKETTVRVDISNGKPPRPPRRRRGDDPSVLSDISDATKIRSGVMTKEQIPVCSAIAYGSELHSEPVLKRGSKGRSILRSGAKLKRANDHLKQRRDEDSSEASVISTVTESPMPINVSPIYSTNEWARKFHEKEEAKAATKNAHIYIGGKFKNSAYPLLSGHQPVSRVPKKRHYYMGLRSTKRPLGKKPTSRSEGLGGVGSDMTSHHLNSLPSNELIGQQSAHLQQDTFHASAAQASYFGSKYSESSRSIDSESYCDESIETEYLDADGVRGQSCNGPRVQSYNELSASTFGRHQAGALHRYGNYSIPEKAEDEGSASTYGSKSSVASVESSHCSRSVRIKTKRRSAETDAIELELLTLAAIAEEDDVLNKEKEAVAKTTTCSKPKLPLVVTLQSPAGNDVADTPVKVSISSSSSSTASSTSSQITSNRSSDDEEAAENVVMEADAREIMDDVDARSSFDGATASCTIPVQDDRSTQSVRSKQSIRSKLSKRSIRSKQSIYSKRAVKCSEEVNNENLYPRHKSLDTTLNDNAQLLMPVESYPTKHENGGDDRYHQAPEEVSTKSSSTAASCGTSSSSDTSSRSNDASRKSPETQHDDSAMKPSTKINVEKSVEDSILAPTNKPILVSTSLAQDKEAEAKRSGFVKETVENMLESAFSPDGENFRSIDKNGHRTRTFRPKIPLFDSMTSSESGASSKDWRDVESWCSSVPEMSRNVSRYERRVKYPNKKNRKGWYAKPVDEIKNRRGIEIDVLQVGLKKQKARKTRGSHKRQNSW